jgi:hypothetical protein
MGLNILKLIAPARPPAEDPPPAAAAVALPAPELLCLRCAFGVVSRGVLCGEELYLCAFGGVLRPLPFLVTDCTEFAERGKRARGADVGFAAGC